MTNRALRPTGKANDPEQDGWISALPVIDAHHHFWDLDRNYHPWLCDEPMIPFRYGSYAPIRRNYLPADYLLDTGRFNLAGSVYVEAEWDPRDPVGETRWIHGIAAEHGLPGAVVAQAWLDHDDAAAVLAAQAAFPLVRSVRHKPRSAAAPGAAIRGAPGSMDDPRWRDGYARLQGHGLHFDLQTPWWHFEAAGDLARDFPATRIIINHTGLPADRSAAGLAAWRDAMARLADAPNVHLKISGIGVPGQPWSVELQRSVVHDALAIFGIERCLFASNFPVDSVIATFEQIYRGFLTLTAHLDDAARRRLFHDNAAALYRVEPRAPRADRRFPFPA
ncbi:MAG: amidohydrolase family protein [Burkholderiaceae bacterium]